MNDQYKIIIASLPDHENVVAEIYINDLFCASVSKEPGKLLTVELPSPSESEEVNRIVNYDLFLEALAAAKARLVIC